MDWWFFIKKGLSLYLHPLPLALEAVVIGLILVGFSRRQTRKQPGKFGRWCRKCSGDLGVLAIIGGVFFLYLCSIKPVAVPLMYGLEKRHPPLALTEMPDYEIAKIDPAHILVLGGGQRYDPLKPPTSQLAAHALARTVEGVRLARIFPKATLVFTGGPEEVRAMTETAIALGVETGRIQSENESRDTLDHPQKVRPIIGDAKFLLVTSGTHMPRAMAIFEAAGYRPTPAACDLWVWPDSSNMGRFDPASYVPHVEHLTMTHLALHEHLGALWNRLTKMEGQGHGVQEKPSPPLPSPAPATPSQPQPESPPVSAPRKKAEPALPLPGPADSAGSRK